MNLPPGMTNNIREVFRYIHRFKGSVFVLKINDELLDAPLLSLLIRDIVHIHNMGIQVVLVAGARHSINTVLDTYGVKTEYDRGVRLTTDAAMPLVKLGSSNFTNVLLTLLSENGVHGVLGNWVKAREVGVIQGVDFQNSGKVESISLGVVSRLLDDGMIPILSNIGYGVTGKPYNISSNDVAVTLAKSIGASKLFFIGNQPGIPVIPQCKIRGIDKRKSGVFSALEIEKARQLLEVHREDLPEESVELIELALEACAAGVNRVHVIDGSRDGMLLQEIFSANGQGTMFHANVHANIRPARREDVPELLHIMQPYVDQGVMVQRMADDILSKLESYYVYAVDDALHGCGALVKYPEGMAEIEAVVVDSNYRGRKTGEKVISFLLEKAQQKGIKKVFVLTTQSSEYFMKLGFEEASVDLLPESKKKQYNKNRMSKVLAVNL